MTGGLLDIIRAAKRPERTVDLCLRGDLVGEFEANERRLKELATGRDESFSASTEPARLADRQKELQAEMRGSTVTFHLRAVGSEKSAELIASHPPRPDEDRDKSLGYNPTTYYPALVMATCYAMTRGEETVTLRDESGAPTDADMSAEDWDRLFDALSQQQFDQLLSSAFDLDHGDVEVPFSPLALLISQRADASSTQQTAGDSRPTNSTAKGADRSRRTSTTKKAASSGR